MFKLPNNKIIDENMAMMGMEDSDLANNYFLDTLTGELALVSEFSNTGEEREQFEDERFIKILQIPAWEQFEWMTTFVKEMVKYENPSLAEKLQIALNGKGAFRRFKYVLESDTEGWLEAWYAWKDDCIYESFRSWLATLPIKSAEEFDFFDDCNVCQLMEHVAPEEQIIDAIKDANHAHKKVKQSN